MIFVRCLVLVCIKFKIFFGTKHIPGVYDHLADALSSFQAFQFKQQAPVQSLPSDVLKQVLQHNSKL